jgi:hypothetical protein
MQLVWALIAALGGSILRILRSAALCTALVCCATPVYAATCAPRTLVHIITVDVTPGVSAHSFAAQPKGLYRIGSDKMRVEEALDSAHGIHGLIVIAEPDIWMINLYDHTGKHIVDPGPTFFAKAPIFGMPDVSPKLSGLELGCEAEFLTAHAAVAVRSEKVGNTRYTVHRVADNPDAVEILEKTGSNRPAFARYYHRGKLASVFRYDLYSTGLADSPDRFVPPSDVRYSEEK